MFPVRNLAKYGVITDVDSYDLPTEAWSMGVNVRFRSSKVSRGPVWRAVKRLGTANPRYAFGATPSSGLDFLFVGYKDGTVARYTGGTEVDYTLTGWTTNSVEATYTNCVLGNIVYFNRSDRTPWYLRVTDTKFQNLTAGAGTYAWPSNWSAKILRASNSILCAFNITIGGVNYPQMVKTSSVAQINSVPTSWDKSDPQSNATENSLADMEGGIVEAQPLGNAMYIYSLNECWQMSYVAGQDIWDYNKAFTKGAINTNCVIEINKRHIVFGPTDIWMHDGVTQKSICDQRTREFIYAGLNASKANRCFIEHNELLHELMFCYVSGDSYAQFTGGPDACNRAAVWDYENDIWTFDDLPLVYFGHRANLDTTLTYATATQSYATVGGSYQDQEDTFKRNAVFVGDDYSGAGLQRTLYAFDPVGPLSQVSSPVDTNATKGSRLERDGIDMDVVGADLRGYKVCNSIYPQGRLDPQAAPVQFTVGAADYFNQNITWDDTMTWDGLTNYKLDFNTAGRFIALHIYFPDYRLWTFSGYDADLDVLAER